MRNNEITRAFISGKEVLDDHTCGRETVKIDALIELCSPNRPLLAYQNGARYQSLNKVYLGKSGDLHLSRVSVGGVIRGNTLDKEAIQSYNNTVTFDGLKIKSVLFRDGSTMDELMKV